MKNIKYLLGVIQYLRKKHKNYAYVKETDFNLAIYDLLISENGYVDGAGSSENVNKTVLELLLEKIEKHPLIWSIFFMVA